MPSQGAWPGLRAGSMFLRDVPNPPSPFFSLQLKKQNKTLKKKKKHGLFEELKDEIIVFFMMKRKS